MADDKKINNCREAVPRPAGEGDRKKIDLRTEKKDLR